jgi:hypothetical protein
MKLVFPFLIAAAVVEVCGSAGYNWFDLPT